jgi:hypothetical protein
MNEEKAKERSKSDRALSEELAFKRNFLGSDIRTGVPLSISYLASFAMLIFSPFHSIQPSPDVCLHTDNANYNAIKLLKNFT